MSLAATLLALGTVLLWSFLGYLGASVSHIPPLLVVGMALCVSGMVSMFRIKGWRVPLTTLAVGIFGLFGYHFLYFSAFQYAPAVEANLMNYLWPLLIVLLSPIYLPDYRLGLHHLIGALMGLVGAGLIITGGRLSLDVSHLWGYLLAAGAALIWASYSLMTKRLPPFPTAAVGAFCLSSGILSLVAFAMSGTAFTLSMLNQSDWIYIILLGAGPMGAAFFTWDAALKRGDPRIIGSLAYLTPMTSTIVLVLLGGHDISLVTLIAMVLIVGGAIVGAKDLLQTRKRVTQVEEV